MPFIRAAFAYLPCCFGSRAKAIKAFIYPARASNPGLTAPSKSWNGRSTGQQGNELPGIGAVSYEGLIPGNPGERPSLFNKPVYY